MTIEDRLRDAFQPVDDYEPSPDLFRRVDMSLAEDRAMRRRRLVIGLSVISGVALIGAWLVFSAERGLAGSVFIDGWRLAIASLTVSLSVIFAVGPHFRRFGQALIDEVFRLGPGTGARFVAVLDVAYYMGFIGLALVDADMWDLGTRILLAPALEDAAFRLGLLLLAMGALHAVNIALLPVIGALYSSIVRLDVRREAGTDAPPESFRARVADRNARSIAIGIAVTALTLAIAVVLGPLAAWLDALQ